jgi:ubiquinol-cytochrome c reductase iron-sulfur subunit
VRKTPDPQRTMALALGASALSSLGAAVVYVLGGDAQLEGALLGTALGGMAVALGLWAKHLMPSGHDVQDRKPVSGGVEAQEEAAGAFEVGAGYIERRGLLAKLLAGALGAFGLASLFPIRSLGARPGSKLFRTAWRPGARLVRMDGSPVRPEELHVDGVLTVFPQRHTEAADSQALLIRLPPGLKPPGPAGWTPDGFVAFSKICTHAGCPVGLYQTETKELFCPCHQSVFAVLEGARPIEGPATRPLPQLPLGVDEEGFLIAQGDFEEPVGPGFWDRGRAPTD